MEDTIILYGQGTGASTYFYTGFAPGFVEVRAMGDGTEDIAYWSPMMPAENSIEIEADDGIHTFDASDGIRLVKFDDSPGSLPGSGGTPSDVENGRFFEANGIEITAGSLGIVDGVPFIVIVHRMTVPIIRAVHDGTAESGTYFEDSSLDFFEAGISDNGKFILISETNDNYAFVGSITKPSGKNKYCRIYTYEDEALSTPTATAAFGTDDVIYIIPRQFAQYPLSDIGLMT